MNFERYLAIDEEGYVWFDGQRLEDAAYGAKLLANLKVTERGRVFTSLDGAGAWVEAFDAPLVARHVARGRLELNYGHAADFTFDTLTVDDWDRFHGRTVDGVPFVLSRAAQVEFFDLLDGFDDDSITVDGRRFPTPKWLCPKDTDRAFWSGHYRKGTTGWDLGEAAPALPQILPQLKLSRARILVPGCGRGHDAAYLARQGFAVTAVDFSPEALGEAQRLYGDVEGLNFVEADVFALPDTFREAFDVVFEHTCYCAINPERRGELVRAYQRALHPTGHLLGIFYVNETPAGPPFGGSEWEVRERLKPAFRSMYWTRWRASVESRRGRELVVYAAKI